MPDPRDDLTRPANERPRTPWPGADPAAAARGIHRHPPRGGSSLGVEEARSSATGPLGTAAEAAR